MKLRLRYKPYYEPGVITCYRRNADGMQNPLSATSVQKDRRCGVGFAEWAESGLCDHISNTFHPTEVYDTLWSSATGL